MPTNIGWGVQPWGTAWGGYVLEDQPVLPIGDFERIHRESRFKHEPETTHSVLFKVEGVEAEANLGRVLCSTGHGTGLHIRRSLRVHCHTGAVAISTGTGTWAKAEAARSYCECGAVEAGVSVRCEMEQGIVAESDVGLTKVRAIRNPTDEEFLMMLAEML